MHLHNFARSYFNNLAWWWLNKSKQMSLELMWTRFVVDFYDVGSRPLACWDIGFESRRGHGCLSLESVACCQVEVSATGWSLIQGSPTECDLEVSTMRRLWPTRGFCTIGVGVVEEKESDRKFKISHPTLSPIFVHKRFL